MRRFLSLRYVMTSNVPFEKNKMASTYSVFTKCKEAERRVKFKENRLRCGEETEKVKRVLPWESCSANFIQQQMS